eukprot:5055605-Prymnesium_polylepis.1
MKATARHHQLPQSDLDDHPCGVDHASRAPLCASAIRGSGYGSAQAGCVEVKEAVARACVRTFTHSACGGRG